MGLDHRLALVFYNMEMCVYLIEQISFYLFQLEYFTLCKVVKLLISIFYKVNILSKRAKSALSANNHKCFFRRAIEVPYTKLLLLCKDTLFRPWKK